MSSGWRYVLWAVPAIGAHAAVLFALKGGLVQPPEYDVAAGDLSVEVSLVAAPPAAPEPAPATESEPPVEHEPEPETEIEPEPEPMAEATPTPEPAPEPKATPRPEPAPAPEKKPKLTPRPKPRTGPVGDGSSAVPGRDATTARAGAAGDRAKPGYLRNPQPAYPPEARRAGQQGTVQILVRVDSRGGVSSARIVRSSGHSLLDERALSTVRARWRFKPARAGGVPVASEVVVPIRFQLRN